MELCVAKVAVDNEDEDDDEHPVGEGCITRVLILDKKSRAISDPA